MAIDPSALYGAQVDTSDFAGYPLGKARNDLISGDGNGTPLDKNWVSDSWGFFQALLDAAGITASGDPDKVGASQYLDAIRSLCGPSATYELTVGNTTLSDHPITAIDQDAGFSVASNLITVPSPGKYLVSWGGALVTSDTAANQRLALLVRVGSTTFCAASGLRTSTSAADYVSVGRSYVVTVTGTQKIYFRMASSGGGTLGVATGFDGENRVSVTKLS